MRTYVLKGGWQHRLEVSIMMVTGQRRDNRWWLDTCDGALRVDRGDVYVGEWATWPAMSRGPAARASSV